MLSDPVQSIYRLHRNREGQHVKLSAFPHFPSHADYLRFWKWKPYVTWQFKCKPLFMSFPAEYSMYWICELVFPTLVFLLTLLRGSFFRLNRQHIDPGRLLSVILRDGKGNDFRFQKDIFSPWLQVFCISGKFLEVVNPFFPDTSTVLSL